MKTKLLKESTDLSNNTCIYPVLPEYAGNIENSGWFVTPQLQIFYEQLLWSQSCISHICKTELSYSMAVSARWATQGLWSTTNCTWGVALQSTTQAGRQHSRPDVFLPCRPRICREPRPAASPHRDRSEPTHATHLLHLTHCKRLRGGDRTKKTK